MSIQKDKYSVEGKIYNYNTDTYVYSDGSGFETREQILNKELLNDKWKYIFASGKGFDMDTFLNTKF